MRTLFDTSVLVPALTDQLSGITVEPYRNGIGYESRAVAQE
jgi:hypothetical protein